MIFLLTKEHSPRLQWIADILLHQILGQNFEILIYQDGIELPAPGFALHYHGSAAPGLNIEAEGLLFEKGIRPANQDSTALWQSKDFFAQAFYLLSDYEHWQDRKENPKKSPNRDIHDRFLGDMSERNLSAVIDQLLLHIQQTYPGFQRAKPAFDYEITLDVDRPWKYLHKGAKVLYGGWFKDLVKGKFNEFKERGRTIFGKKDPFDVYEELHRRLPVGKSRFFFLVGGDHSNDSRFSAKTPAFRDLIENLHQKKKFPIGLHPSYESYKNPAFIKAEKAALEAITGPVTHSRQHYLRYAPETLRSLEALGIRHEYSLGPFGHPERRFPPLSQPYLWFDLEQNRISALTLHPAQIMDRPQLPAFKKDVKAPFAAMQQRAAAIARQGGKFILILHNETFSDSGEWKGWKEPLFAFIEELKSLYENQSRA